MTPILSFLGLGRMTEEWQTTSALEVEFEKKSSFVYIGESRIMVGEMAMEEMYLMVTH